MRQLLIKVELLNNQIVIILKSLLDCLTDTQIKFGRQVVAANSRVCFLQLFNPNIKITCFLHKHALVVFFWCNKRCNETCKQGEEGETTELQPDAEHEFSAVKPSVITVAYCSQHSESPIKSKNVDLLWAILLELWVSAIVFWQILELV